MEAALRRGQRDVLNIPYADEPRLMGVPDVET